MHMSRLPKKNKPVNSRKRSKYLASVKAARKRWIGIAGAFLLGVGGLFGSVSEAVANVPPTKMVRIVVVVFKFAGELYGIVVDDKGGGGNR
jgi:hypothetical protein